MAGKVAPAGRKVRTPSKQKKDLVKPTNRKEPPRAPSKSAPPRFNVFSGPDTPDEPQSDVFTLPDPPETLGTTGQEKWIQYGRSLEARNMLSEHYLPSLEHICRLHDQLKAIEDEIDDNLMVMSSWGPKLHPLVPVRNQTMLLIRTMLTDFGMTPTSTRGAAPASGAEPAKKQGGIPRRNRMAVPAGI